MLNLKFVALGAIIGLGIGKIIEWYLERPNNDLVEGDDEW